MQSRELGQEVDCKVYAAIIEMWNYPSYDRKNLEVLGLSNLNNLIDTAKWIRDRSISYLIKPKDDN